MEAAPAAVQLEPTAERTLAGIGDRLRYGALFVGVVGLVVAVLFGGLVGDDYSRFFYSYLLSWAFLASISLGALFFVIVTHLAYARWSVVVRRIAEYLAIGIAPLALLFLPILGAVLFGGEVLYSWNVGPDGIAGDAILAAKAGWLNWGFFVARAGVYLAVWILLARYFLLESLAQDEDGDPERTNSMQTMAGPAAVLFAFTINFAAFDWLMSLAPHWYSTIFGVYYFAGSAVAFFAAATVIASWLQQRNKLHEMTVEHYHDMSKLLYGFVMFWAYIAFSQYLLIWYANIPEETVWYARRMEGVWPIVGIVLMVGHFGIPFFGFMSRDIRRAPLWMTAWGIYMLAVHWFDLVYLVLPEYGRDAAGVLQDPAMTAVTPLGIATDIAALAGIGGLTLAAVLWLVGNHSLIPLKDPRLGRSLAFKNV